MESGQAHDIFMKYCAALAYIEVELPNGDRSIGSAFHVGEGVFITARHVVDGNEILQIASTSHTYVPLVGEEAENAKLTIHKGNEIIPAHPLEPTLFKIDQGPFFHAHEDVDVAAFRVREFDPYTPVIEMGSHLEDWLGYGDFVLSEAIILGYPPVPMTTGPILVGARAEVNAQVDLYDTQYVHFILSSMPRGGFSGGVAISEYGYALGVVTRSLTLNQAPPEMGFMTIMGIEPIYECLADHRLLPDAQAEAWDGFWNSTRLSFYDPKVPSIFPGAFQAAAIIEILNGGKRHALTVKLINSDFEAFEAAIEAADSALAGHSCMLSENEPGAIRIEIPGGGDHVSTTAENAGRSMSAAFMSLGYVPIPDFTESNPLLPSRALTVTHSLVHQAQPATPLA